MVELIVTIDSTQQLDSAEMCTNKPVTANGDALKDAVGLVGDDVVELVAHAAGTRDVRHRARPVQLGVQDVVHHAAGVADLEHFTL